jgi:hypothetical protein
VQTGELREEPIEPAEQVSMSDVLIFLAQKHFA